MNKCLGTRHQTIASTPRGISTQTARMNQAIGRTTNNIYATSCISFAEGSFYELGLGVSKLSE
eukprot:1759896-Amphidinium_carterae.1